MWQSIITFACTVGLQVMKSIITANKKQDEKDKLFLRHIEIYQQRRSNVGAVATDFESKLAKALAEMDAEEHSQL